VFGSETAGLPDAVRASFTPQGLKLPMRGGPAQPEPVQRRGVTVFEAWRQNGFAGAAQE
jgi:tRNA (cytidine/uridine-2'-O-)-methyltransferase